MKSLLLILRTPSPQFISTAPSAPPANVRGNNVSSTSIAVYWDELPLNDQNGVITSYNICYKAVAGGFKRPATENCISVSGASTKTVTIPALEKYVLYNITVAAITGVGEGPKSSGTSVRTAEDSKFEKVD